MCVTRGSALHAVTSSNGRQLVKEVCHVITAWMRTGGGRMRRRCGSACVTMHIPTNQRCSLTLSGDRAGLLLTWAAYHFHSAF